MPMRTGKQTALLIFGIVKTLGAVLFCALGIFLLVSEVPPEFVSSFIDRYEGASGSYLYYSDVMDAIRGVGIVCLVLGLGGVVHGLMNFLGARAGMGSDAVVAGVFGILGCVLVDILFVIATGFIGLFMLALNVAQTIIAFMVSSEANSPTGIYPGYGQPGVPVQGGYPSYSQQQAMSPQSPYLGYPQPGMPPQQDAYQGYPQPGMPPQQDAYQGYSQPGMPPQQDAYPGYPQQQMPPQQNGNYPTL